MANVVAAGDVGQRFITSIAARDGFAALVRCQLARAAEQHATAVRRLAARVPPGQRGGVRAMFFTRAGVPVIRRQG